MSRRHPFHDPRDDKFIYWFIGLSLLMGIIAIFVLGFAGVTL